MAVKKIYIGSVGPFEYDDTDLIEDADGDFAGEYQQAIRTNGALISGDGTFATGSVMIVTALQVGGAGTIGFQYKNRSLTLVSGLVTVIGAESAWTDV